MLPVGSKPVKPPWQRDPGNAAAKRNSGKMSQRGRTGTGRLDLDGNIELRLYMRIA
jgi:hypothetical protein